MKSQKVELLAPAGNYESFIGAINAGADAIYVGGEKFSARAYAQNFDTDTLCACIKYAHLFGRRVYLTLNTLIKEKEFSEIYDYVKPFYLAGLDGMIVQDFGVLRFLKANFPHMELHASTQMAVTGPEFVKLCKEFGVSRVVPARELSLKELKAIADAGIEVECFIHGAMCYCYSGMCLMSSILGGRSGNRGKCAQPCRLPYDVTVENNTSNNIYPLSLKDMCTMEHIPQLIEAGMDSFKIEGRMKRGEYVAGVTALYRKYIDDYYDNPKRPIQISTKDRYILKHLYMRSQLHDGYLSKHNDKEMVTLHEPSYSGVEEEILSEIRNKYLLHTQKVPMSMYAYFSVGNPCVLTVYTEDGHSVSVNGDVVSAANQLSATKDAVLKQLSKLGNTHFSLKEATVEIEGEAFLPNGMLNALRREAIEQLENAIISSQFPKLALRKMSDTDVASNTKLPHDAGLQKRTFSILVNTAEQLDVVLNHPLLDKVEALYLEESALEYFLQKQYAVPKDISVVFAMPYILRGEHLEAQRMYLQSLSKKGIQKVLVRNTEELALAKTLTDTYGLSLVTDASLYCWNQSAVAAMKEYASKVTLPLELNAKEMRSLRRTFTEQIIYGYIPLMITANCIYKTTASCKKGQANGAHKALLKDRYGKIFTAVTNCKYCYNIIYNSVPLSLHKKYNQDLPGSVRLQFSIEEAEQMKEILNYYLDWSDNKPSIFPIEEYTTAHENRQVE